MIAWGEGDAAGGGVTHEERPGVARWEARDPSTDRIYRGQRRR